MSARTMKSLRVKAGYVEIEFLENGQRKILDISIPSIED